MHAVVVAGGAPPDAGDLASVPDDALVVAADSGVGALLAGGRTPDVVVGDLDSARPADVHTARDRGARVDTHPADKDATDLALAMTVAVAEGATALTVLGHAGGRLDHELANLLLLADEAWADVRVDARHGGTRTTVVRGTRALTGHPGDLVTLLAVAGPAEGVRTEGLRWALADETLGPTSTRGVSNELVVPEAIVTVRRGVLLAIQPGGPT